jgi:hypothetical protein
MTDSASPGRSRAFGVAVAIGGVAAMKNMKFFVI